MLLLAANVELALEGDRERSSPAFSGSAVDSRLRPGNLKLPSVEDTSDTVFSAFLRRANEDFSRSAVCRNQVGSLDESAWDICEREGVASSSNAIVSLLFSTVSNDGGVFSACSVNSSAPSLATLDSSLAPVGGVEGMLPESSCGSSQYDFSEDNVSCSNDSPDGWKTCGGRRAMVLRFAKGETEVGVEGEKSLMGEIERARSADEDVC
jgi:hypothetical protein